MGLEISDGTASIMKLIVARVRSGAGGGGVNRQGCFLNDVA